MQLKFLLLFGVTAVLIDTPAPAETCTLEITGPKDQWIFVHVYDIATGEIVLRQAIKAGDSKLVTVSGDRVRVDWKLAGHASYQTGAVIACKGGNKVKV